MQNRVVDLLDSWRKIFEDYHAAGVEPTTLLQTSHVPGQAARTIAGLLTLRDHVIGPILAGIRRPGPGRPPKTRTRIDRDYEHLRDGMRTLLHDLAIDAAA